MIITIAHLINMVRYFIVRKRVIALDAQGMAKVILEPVQLIFDFLGSLPIRI